MTPPTINVSLIAAARRISARDNFTDFCRIVDIPGAPIDDDESMLLPTTWNRPMTAHHKLLTETLQKVETGEIKRLMVFMPPGSAKSTYGSVLFPAYFIGKKRGRTVVCVSYNSELATSMGEKTRSVVQQEVYSDVFKRRMDTTTSAKDNWKLDNGNEYYAAGFMAGITGRRAHLVIVDDPLKGQASADSQGDRDKIWKEWESSVTTRAVPDTRFVIIQTRWHEDDLAGRILPEGYKGQSGKILCRDGMEWEVINIPAEAYLADDPLKRQPGDMLWPEYFTADHWKPFRNGNQRVWNALFQQRPSGDEGTEFRKEWFTGGVINDGQGNRVEFEPTMFDPSSAPENLNIYMTSDHARRESARSDYNVFRIWGVDHRGHIWLLDSVRRKGDLLDAMGVTSALGALQIADSPTSRGALALIRRWKPRKWFPESDPSWQTSERMIRSYLRDFGLWCQIDEKSTRVKGAIGKVEKARPYIRMCEEGKVHLPTNSIGHDALDEYIPFPAGTHDDQVDADSMMGRVIGEYHKALLPPVLVTQKTDTYKELVTKDIHSQDNLF